MTRFRYIFYTVLPLFLTSCGIPNAPVSVPSGSYLNVWSRGRINTSLLSQAKSSVATGVQSQLVWSEYTGSLDQIFDSVAPKKVVLIFTAATGQYRKGFQSNTGTPEYILNDESISIVSIGSLVYPLWSDPDYLSRLEEFVIDFSSKYDGDPRISFIRIGGISTGTNEFIRVYSGAESDPDFASQLELYDYDHSFAMRETLILWKRHFKKTPLAVTMSFGKSINELANDLGYIILNTGLNTCPRSVDVLDEIQSFSYFGWGGVTNLHKCPGDKMDAARVAIESGSKIVVVKNWSNAEIEYLEKHLVPLEDRVKGR